MNLKDYLSQAGKAFSDGNLDVAAAVLAAPLTVHCGARRMLARTQSDLENALKLYRENLQRECYRETRMELQFVSKGTGGEIQALVTWHHYNDRGAEIDALEAAYIFSKKADGRLTADKVDFMPVARKRMIEGLAIA